MRPAKPMIERPRLIQRRLVHRLGTALDLTNRYRGHVPENAFINIGHRARDLCIAPWERPRTLASVVTLVLVLLLSGGWALAGDLEVSMVSYETEAEAMGNLYVRIRVANHGAVPVRPCDTSVDQVSDTEPCVAVTYRKGKRPPRLSFSKVEVVPAIGKPIQPGEIFETNVPIPTPKSQAKFLVYVYLVTGEAGKLVWKEFPLDVNVSRPAPDMTRRILVARTLLALYVFGTVWMIWRVWRAPSAGRTR